MYIHLAYVTNDHIKVLPALTTPFLQSYWYTKKLGRRNEAVVLDGASRMPFMVDSGTFSLVMKMERDPLWEMNVSDIEEYILGYAEWIRQNAGTIKVAVEADMDPVVGHEKVREWRDNIFFPLQEETGVKIMFVWRVGGTLEQANRLLQDPRVRVSGIGGAAMAGNSDKKMIAKMRGYCIEANRRQIPVHGFGITRMELLEYVPFASVDSTSWSSNDRFGNTWGYNPSMGMRSLRKKAIRTRLAGNKAANYALSLGAVPGLYADEKANRLAMFIQGGRAMGHFADNLTAIWRRRGIDWSRALENTYEETYIPEGEAW